MYVHGGFEPEAPSIPTDIINNIDLKKLFENNTNLNKIFKKDQMEIKKNTKELMEDRPVSSESF